MSIEWLRLLFFTMNKKKTDNSCFGCFGIIIVALFLFYMIGQCENETNEVDWSEASVISEVFLKTYMKFPDDVKFVRESRKVIEEQDKVFKVTGRLKANNMFGQAVPYSYNVRVQYNGGDWSEFSNGMPTNWTFLGGNLYNEATGDYEELY